ncbi:MAG: hypothetical protein IT355_20610 [Gemmatimonadaceae bacterium]|nr:hypothetical protein [Gemmatimonadaceae bacterium]
MTDSLDLPSMTQNAIERAYTDAKARADAAAADVIRLAALIESALRAVGDAEARATDAVASPDFDDTSDADVMGAVAAARARHSAAVAAHARAKGVAASAVAAVAPFLQQLRRSEAVRELDALAPALANIDRAIELLAEAIPIVEHGYDTAAAALLKSRSSTPVPLQLARRIRSLLWRRHGSDVFFNSDGHGTVDLVKQPSLQEDFADVTAHLRGTSSLASPSRAPSVEPGAVARRECEETSAPSITVVEVNLNRGPAVSYTPHGGQG